MLLVVALEGDCDTEYVLAQQAALGADLIGRDRLVLGAQRGVEDAHVGFRGGVTGLGSRGGQRMVPAEQGHRGGRQHQTGTGQRTATRTQQEVLRQHESLTVHGHLLGG